MLPAQTQNSRPTVGAAVCSPTAWANLLASLFLLPCIGLPYTRGPLGEVSQWDCVRFFIQSGASADPRMLITIWLYGFALATILTIGSLVWLRPAWWQRALFGLPFVWTGVLVLLWAVLLFSDADSSRLAMLIAALVAPPLVLCITKMLWLCREEKSLWAASWGYSFICVLAMFSQRWLLPSPGWGAGLSIVALTLMMLASWTWGARARYDLFDQSQPPERMQLSIRQIAWGISLVAIALAYWRALSQWSS